MSDVPPCRCCGKPADSWHEERPELAICPDCCATAEHPDGESGHQYAYEGGDGYLCRYCGMPATDEWLADRANP